MSRALITDPYKHLTDAELGRRREILEYLRKTCSTIQVREIIDKSLDNINGEMNRREAPGLTAPFIEDDVPFT